MLQIGNVTLEHELIMAPMAGITNLPFRLMVKRLGAGLVNSEMVSAMGLIRGQKKTLDYLKSHPAEKPLAVQIFGSKPDVMARAAQIVVEAGANVVDINMGCPVKKVVKTGAGAALLRDPKKVGEMVSAVRLACHVPLTVKIRAGWSSEQPNACDIARVIEDCGADAVTVHPRFATQRYSVPADWSVIRQVKAKSNIPVIGNGDVFEPSSAIKMKKETGCDGVMIGRGAVGNPWLFRQILNLENGLPTVRPTLFERRNLIMEHFRALTETMGEHRAALAMRGLLLWYSKGLPHSSRFRGHISKINDMDSLTEIMDDYFASLNSSTEAFI
ncbi:MAG: tRNA dihydrouridine synthase DusB [Deltaproteobacteria bacterium]|nr:tRNA dihydrouridine synthase DusB [Deltaproteobacteria bacterium]